MFLNQSGLSIYFDFFQTDIDFTCKFLPIATGLFEATETSLLVSCSSLGKTSPFMNFLK